MHLPGLDDSEQAMAFVYEVNATRNILSYATRIVATDALTENTRDPIMSLMAAGLERLYKLTLGVIAVDRDGSWNDGKVFGHQISKMHPEVLSQIEQRSHAKPYLQELLCEVHDDLVLPAVIRCADSYGREGRYFYLDTLAGTPPRVVSPHAAWRMVEAAVREQHQVAETQTRAAQDPANNERWVALTGARGAVINRSVINIWNLIANCGAHGVLGDLGAVLGRDVRPASVGRQ